MLQTRLGSVDRLLAQYQADGVLKPMHPVADGVLKPMHPVYMLASLVGPLITMNMMQSALTDIPLPRIDLESHTVPHMNTSLEKST